VQNSRLSKRPRSVAAEAGLCIVLTYCTASEAINVRVGSGTLGQLAGHVISQSLTKLRVTTMTGDRSSIQLAKLHRVTIAWRHVDRNMGQETIGYEY
jgi:hypothetical protein